MNKYKDFGNRLKTLREQQGMKQGQFADMIGISRQSMSNYESGKHSPDVDVIVKMAHALNCSTDYLMGLDERVSIKLQIEHEYPSLEVYSIDELLAEIKRRVGEE